MKWYNNVKHLQQINKKGTPLTVVLITNDRENCQKAIETGIEAHTIYEYAKSLNEYPSLVDHIARSESDTTNLLLSG